MSVDPKVNKKKIKSPAEIETKESSKQVPDSDSKDLKKTKKQDDDVPEKVKGDVDAHEYDKDTK